jgi:hypothetical protein
MTLKHFQARVECHIAPKYSLGIIQKATLLIHAFQNSAKAWTKVISNKYAMQCVAIAFPSLQGL